MMDTHKTNTGLCSDVTADTQIDGHWTGFISFTHRPTSATL